MIIYKVTNKINGKIYIGQSVLSLDKRKKSHYKEAKYKKEDNTYFHNALRKYRKEDFIWEIIEDKISTIEELNEKEIYYISLFNTTNKEFGYNLKAGGNGGGTNSEATKIKIGKTTKRKWAIPEIAAKMLQGIYNSAKVSKEKAENNYKTTLCKNCHKEIVYRPMDVNNPPSFCCPECYHSYLKNNNKGLLVANQINKEKVLEKDSNTKNIIIEWLIQNNSFLVDLKYNKLQSIFNELKNITGFKDERTIMRPFKINSRKKFVTELSKIYAELTGNCKN